MAMEREREYGEIRDLFFRLISRFQAIEKIPRDFGVGEPLFPSEIHMIDAIGRNPGINLTGLAALLGITKGAVPKQVQKLERKSLVRRYRDDENMKEVLFALTDGGESARRAHEKYHAKIDRKMIELMNSLDEEKLEALKSVFTGLDRYAEKILSGK